MLSISSTLAVPTPKNSFPDFSNSKILFSKSDNKKIGYVCFFTQLILNFSWTPAFFIFKNIIVALIIIILLDIMIFFTIKEFAKVSRLSALFLVPYFLWVLFATYLNIGFLVLNN